MKTKKINFVEGAGIAISATESEDGQTDITIQSTVTDGDGGLLAVSHDETLEGNGTPDNPLHAVQQETGLDQILINGSVVASS